MADPVGTQGQTSIVIGTAIPVGTNAIGTVSALQSGTWVVGSGANTIGTVQNVISTALFTSGTVGPISTTTAQTIIAAAAGSTIFVGSLQVGNTGTVVATAKLSDIGTTVVVIPATNALTYIFTPPLQTAVGSALTIALGTVSTSIYASAQGHY